MSVFFRNGPPLRQRGLAVNLCASACVRREMKVSVTRSERSNIVHDTIDKEDLFINLLCAVWFQISSSVIV